MKSLGKEREKLTRKAGIEIGARKKKTKKEKLNYKIDKGTTYDDNRKESGTALLTTTRIDGQAKKNETKRKRSNATFRRQAAIKINVLAERR
ncbi:hypothetical protein Tco_1208192 [Tanacetum coccineum]